MIKYNTGRWGIGIKQKGDSENWKHILISHLNISKYYQDYTHNENQNFHSEPHNFFCFVFAVDISSIFHVFLACLTKVRSICCISGLRIHSILWGKFNFLKALTVRSQENVIERWHQKAKLLGDIIQTIAEPLDTIPLDSLWFFWGVIFEEHTELKQLE